MEPIAPPGAREPSDTFRFSSGDGTQLYGEYFAASGPSAALVVHGYAEHCGRYREVASGSGSPHADL